MDQRIFDFAVRHVSGRWVVWILLWSQSCLQDWMVNLLKDETVDLGCTESQWEPYTSWWWLPAQMNDPRPCCVQSSHGLQNCFDTELVLTVGEKLTHAVGRYRLCFGSVSNPRPHLKSWCPKLVCCRQLSDGVSWSVFQLLRGHHMGVVDKCA